MPLTAAVPIPGFATRRVDLTGGPIHYREAGSGPPIVFVHGFAVNGRLWERVATRLVDDARCLVPDWPMGSHVEAMRADADVTPGGVARMVAEFCEALDLEDVTIVGNDSGGAVSQLVATRHPERVGRLVLTNCDAIDTFPPGHFRWMARAMRLPGVTPVMIASMRSRLVLRSWIAFGSLTREPIDVDLLREWVAPAQRDAGIRRDLRAFFTGAGPHLVREAAERLPSMQAPLDLVWGDADRFFTQDIARRLAELAPDSHLTWIPGGMTFCPLEDDEPIAAAIRAALARGSASG